MIKKTILYTILVLLISGCLSRHTLYGVADTPAISEDGKYINCIIAESIGTVTMENGGYNKTTYKTTYWLKQYETATGKITNKKKLVPSSLPENVDIDCYGVFDNKIWLYVNGIRAYDMNSLEEVTNEKQIATANGMKKTIFPYDERLVYPAVEKGYIDFIADNGEEYRLQLQELKIINKNEIKDNTGKRKTYFHHDDEYGVRCDTFSNSVFVFAKNEAAANEARPGYNGLPESAYRSKLFKGSFTLTPLGDHNSLSYQHITEAGNDTYLNPCFAVNTINYNVIHLSSPDGFILIHQDVTGEKSKAIISRIDINGKKLWEKATDVSTKISQCMMAGKYLVVTTNKDYMFSPHIGKDAIRIIDTDNGNIVQSSLQE